MYRVLCGAILNLCLVGTIVDIAVSFTDSLLNADDGFVLHRAASQIKPDTEKTSLLQSSPEANGEGCTTLSRHQQEPVLPSECATELRHLSLTRLY